MSDTPNYITYHLDNLSDNERQQVIEWFERVLANEPDRVAERYSLAVNLLQIGRNEDAAAQLKIVASKGSDTLRRHAKLLLDKMSG